ncbi:hypothetical protein [Streptomyces sp. G-5]|uniref:hypothetical protein n=1 Tax=Streptomyces sp. G-5 TaxID=2977231 RepID=UPI0021D0EF54|nr:hypothetical protein [Streptomyces sp. G-5]MCU4748317.1 hypothetical protein [Streptomyces sp. G-5]
MRKAVRLAAPAAIAAAALILTGCSGDSDSKDDDAKGGDSQQESTTGGDTGTDTDDGADADADTEAPAGDAPTGEDLVGMWGILDEGDESAIFMFSDTGSTAYAPTGSDLADECFGTVSDGTLSLDCVDGGNWTDGTLALDGDALNVVWADGATESFTKIEGLGFEEALAGAEFTDSASLEALLDAALDF